MGAGGRIYAMTSAGATRAHPDTAWITGNVIGVDGGEDIVG